MRTRKLSRKAIDEAVEIAGKVMSNSERRYRMRHRQTGLSMSLTTIPWRGKGGWQSSHSHSPGVVEVFVIFEGWVVVASQKPHSPIELKEYSAGETFRLCAGDEHCLCVSPGTSFTTTKYGDAPGGKDWIPAPDLDRVLATIPWDKARQYARRSD